MAPPRGRGPGDMNPPPRFRHGEAGPPAGGYLLRLLIVAIALPAAAVVVGVLILIGAIKMMRLRSLGLVRTSAVLALLPLPLPCPITWALGLAMGIWALVVLARPEVKAAFGKAGTGKPAAAPAPAASGHDSR